MRKVFLAVFAVLVLLAGVAEAKVETYKYQFVLVANTDGQTASSVWNWDAGAEAWVRTSPAKVMDLSDAISPIQVIWDSATGACDSTNYDINFTTAIDPSVFTTTTHFYSKDDETKDTIEALQGGLTVTSRYLKPTVDEDSALTCTLDIYFEITKK